MSRAYRKLLKERELLEQQAHSSASKENVPEDSDDSSDEEDEVITATTGGSFAFLMADDEIDDDDKVDEDENEDGTDEAGQNASASPSVARPAVSGNKPKSGKQAKDKKGTKQQKKNKNQQLQASQFKDRKGKKKKQAGGDEDSDDSDDEIEKAVRDINKKYGELSVSNESMSSSAKAILVVDARSLNPELEMKRLFGSRVVNDGEEGARRNNRRGAAALSSRRFMFATPKETWPRFEALGLKMEKTHTDDDGNMHFAFTHNLKYQEIECRYIDAQLTHNPNNIANVLQLYPYHISSLLQMMEVCRHSGDHAMAGDLLDRALHAFQHAFHPLFNVSLPNVRLNYSVYENRAFFVALYAFLQALSRKGCWKTGYEVCKLLYNLDPDADPFAALLYIDFFALKAEEPSVVIRMYDEWRDSKGLSLFPSWQYSYALAVFRTGEKEQGLKHLVKAIAHYSWAVRALYSKCGVTDADVMGNKIFSYKGSDLPNESSEAALNLLVELFAEISHPIWKEPEALAFLREGVATFLTQMRQPTTVSQRLFKDGLDVRKSRYGGGVPRNIYRLVVSADLKITSLAHLLPEDMNMLDPVPPHNSHSSPYAEYYRKRESERRGLSGLENFGVVGAFLQTLMPWVGAPGGGGDEGDAQDAPGGAARRRAEQQRQLRQMEEHLDGMDEADMRAAVNAQFPGVFPEDGAGEVAGLRETMRALGAQLHQALQHRQDGAVPNNPAVQADEEIDQGIADDDPGRGV